MSANGLTPHEVFDSNYDYEHAAHERDNPRHPTLNVVGRVALLFASDENAERIQEKFSATVAWFKEKTGEWNHKRLDEKAARKMRGSLSVITDQFKDHLPTLTPRSEGAGLYHSYNSELDLEPDEPTDQDEMHQIMVGAVKRARESLGPLPHILKSTHKPLQDPNAPLPGRRPMAHADAFKNDYAGEATTNNEALDRLAQAAQDGTLATMGELERRSSQPRERPDTIAVFRDDELPSRRKAKKDDDVPQISDAKAPDDAALWARLEGAFTDTPHPEDTASRQRPYLGHNKPSYQPDGRRKSDKDKLDSTNA